MLTYNRLEINKKNIKYVSNKFPDCELLLVDNNSTDGTKEFLSTLNRIKKIFLDKNIGIPAARNIGAQNANGDIIIFIDNDIFIKTNLNLIAKSFEKDPKLAVIGGKMLDMNNKIDSWVYKINKYKYSSRSFLTYVFAGGAVAIRKTAFYEVGKFDGTLFFSQEERDISLRFLDSDYKIIYDPSFVFFHQNVKQGKIIEGNRFYWNFVNIIKVIYKNMPTEIVLLLSLKWIIKNFYIAFKNNFYKEYWKALKEITTSINKWKGIRVRRKTTIRYFILKYFFRQYNISI